MTTTTTKPTPTGIEGDEITFRLGNKLVRANLNRKDREELERDGSICLESGYNLYWVRRTTRGSYVGKSLGFSKAGRDEFERKYKEREEWIASNNIGIADRAIQEGPDADGWMLNHLRSEVPQWLFNALHNDQAKWLVAAL